MATDEQLTAMAADLGGEMAEIVTLSEAKEAWARLRRYLELQNSLWTERDTGRQERERDMHIIDKKFLRLALIKNDS